MMSLLNNTCFMPNRHEVDREQCYLATVTPRRRTAVTSRRTTAEKAAPAAAGRDPGENCSGNCREGRADER
ncbi:hypothetical protein KQX54_000476 [Cotesia glomerata]|uniref:Uncharacterized protein n=1 Tax=Cotesia glomerata TaxID=32391 RepID=A0AAV7IIG5_COTGL|nr:hypothetical protein KQX54_000476 [Cotesia glomerata]